MAGAYCTSTLASSLSAGKVMQDTDCHDGADEQEEVASRSNKKKKSGSRSKSGQVKVDRERLMTSTEAAATNEKLPKGFMYVPAHRLNSGTISGND